MLTMQEALLLATLLLGAAVIAVPLAARLGLGSVLGYLLAGVAIGPLLDAEAADLQHVAEFGVVMMLFSVQQNVLGTTLSGDLLLIVALSMLITPLPFIVYDLLSHRMKANDVHEPEDEIDEKGTVIIAGIGRFGQVVNRLVQSSGFSTVVLDNDLKTIQLMRTFGFKGFFGDSTRPDILHAACLNDAAVLVVALDDKDAAVRLVKYARSHRPELHIVARDRVHVYELFSAGANDMVRELFDSSLRAGSYVLKNLGLTEYEASAAEMSFYHADRHILRDLAEAWDPDTPIAENTAYVERARAANRDLETRLAEELDEAQHKSVRAGGRPASGSDPQQK
jgi:CPA2 family monovalent cation:H+ antiporter-2